ncbi:O-antigen ligase family protein [Devosia oryziradicis]|uniref:O-antigen ligase family protein n=1 Tax=Devosia oryziradicis TaxID=2801335 RepID=A0ABX7BU33_9HYPH|nr:O-antigen ligase family protein [Devosia oryziradicis]QQR35437.1 O-antigen ligase family protein [Devosia oryziradicis]
MKASAAIADIADDARAAPYVLGGAWVAAFSLLVYLAVLWPRLLGFSLGFTNQTPISALTVAMFLGAVILFASRPAVMRHYSSAGQLNVAFGLFLALLLSKYVSAYAGQDPPGSVNALNNTLAYFMSFFVIGLAMFVDPRNEENFPRILLVAGLVAACLGIYEMIRQNSLTVEFGWIFNFGGPQNLAGENLKANMYRGGLLRAKSTFTHPIVFGQFIAACLPLVFLVTPERRGKLWRWGLSFIAFGLAILSSNTRSPLAGAAVALAVYWGLGVISSGRSRRAVFVAVAGAAIALIAFLIFGEDLLGLLGGRTAEEASSSQVRSMMFERALFALDSSPLLGYGEGRAVYVAGVFSQLGTLTIDSLYLSYLIDNGYFGLGMFVLFFTYIFLVGIWASRRIQDHARKRRLNAVIAFTFAILFGQSVLSIQDNLVFAYLGAAYIIAVAASARSRQAFETGLVPSTATQATL